MGASLGTETIAGDEFDVHSELALPAEGPPANDPPAAPGWGIWHGTEVMLGH